MFIYPFIWLISASLKPRGDVFDNRLIPETLTFENYLNVWQDAPLGLWLLNTAMVGGWTEIFFRKRALRSGAVVAGTMVATGGGVKDTVPTLCAIVLEMSWTRAGGDPSTHFHRR